MAVAVLHNSIPCVPEASPNDAVGHAALTIEEALERTAGRTIFICMHAHDARRSYDGHCEVCWDCRSVRHPPGGYWPAVTRIQLESCQMVAPNGAKVAHDWRVNPVSPSGPSP